jgi:hypothetical protein
MMKESRLIFRITLWRPWLLALTPLVLLAALGIVLTVAAGDLAAASGILLGLAGVAAALLVPIGLAVRASQWYVDPNGIGGRNNWLVYHRLDWSEIESVEPKLIPGYPYLQVNGGGQRWAFWLPLFLTDMPGFRSAVMRYPPRKTRCGATWRYTRPNQALRQTGHGASGSPSCGAFRPHPLLKLLHNLTQRRKDTKNF